RRPGGKGSSRTGWCSWCSRSRLPARPPVDRGQVRRSLHSLAKTRGSPLPTSNQNAGRCRYGRPTHAKPVPDPPELTLILAGKEHDRSIAFLPECASVSHSRGSVPRRTSQVGAQKNPGQRCLSSIHSTCRIGMSHAVLIEVMRLSHQEKGQSSELTAPLTRGSLATERFLSPAQRLRPFKTGEGQQPCCPSRLYEASQ